MVDYTQIVQNYNRVKGIAGHAQEIFEAMKKVSEEKRLKFYRPDDVEIMLQEAVDYCYLRPEFLEDEELYRGNIWWLINHEDEEYELYS